MTSTPGRKSSCCVLRVGVSVVLAEEGVWHVSKASALLGSGMEHPTPGPDGGLTWSHPDHANAAWDGV